MSPKETFPDSRAAVEIIAQRLITLCEQNQFIQAQEELYAPLIERVETDGTKTIGLENTLAQERAFLAKVENLSTRISNLSITDRYFSLRMAVEMTLKNRQVVKTEEICVYKVANGKIVAEQFFR